MADTSATEEEKKAEDEDRPTGGVSLRVMRREEIPLVDKRSFASFMGCVVVLNVMMIGFETEFQTMPIFGAINNGFLLVYILEIICRLLTHGFLVLKDAYNVMDLCIVSLSVLERMMSSSGMARALPTFRLFRLARLLRSSKLLKHNRELRAVSNTTVKMFKTLVWVMFFLFFILWILATFAYIVIGRSAEWNESMDPLKESEPFEAFDIQEYFGSVTRSFLTLCQIVTLSHWAPHVARPIVKVYPISFAFFVMVLFSTTYGVLVTIVSNLVQDSMAASKENAKAIKDKDREERKKAGSKARDILAEVDADASGELDIDEIAYALEVTNLPVILRDLGVPVMDAESLVRLLDYNGNGLVSYEELVDGVVKMDEEITKRDYSMMGFWVHNLLMRTNHLEERLQLIVEKVSFVSKRLTGSFGALNHMMRTAKDTQCRQKAIHILRTSGPALPPSLDKIKVKKHTLDGRDPKVELVAFASRLLGQPPKPKRSGSPSLLDDGRLALFHNTMAKEIPGTLENSMRQARRDNVVHQDKYAVRMDCVRDSAGRPQQIRGNTRLAKTENPNLRTLRRLL